MRSVLALIAAGPPIPDHTYAGVAVTIYNAVGFFGGAVLIGVCAFAPDRWLDRSPEASHA